MLKLKRLKIEKFRNVEPGTEMRFSDGFNVLLGQNGTGKTTLLELISRVVRSDFSDLAREEFAIEYELALEGHVIAVALSNKREAQALPPTSPELMLALKAAHRGDTFKPAASVQVTGSDGLREMRWDGEETLGVHHAIGRDSPLVAGVLYMAIATSQSVRPLAAALDSGVRFDESLDLLRVLASSPDFPGELMMVTGEWIPTRPSPAPMPASMLSKIGEAHARNPGATAITFSAEDFGFLGQLATMMGFARAELTMEVLARRRIDEYELQQLGNLTFRFFFDGSDFITHDRLSYGQKRLLTFFYYLASNPDIIIADELVNGLHHQWITACIDAIGSRQAFLTSQNPLLLDYLPMTSPEQIRSSFIFCRGERRDGRPRWRWENMSEEDAAELHAAYQVGIEHVSEILQSRGLW